MPNNPNQLPTSINLFLQQLIVAIRNIPPTTNALAFVDPVGEFLQVLSWNFRLRILKKIYSSPPSLDRRMKPSRCFTKGFSSLKRILRTSQIYKLPIGVFEWIEEDEEEIATT
jgi:hypothetical protein